MGFDINDKLESVKTFAAGIKSSRDSADSKAANEDLDRIRKIVKEAQSAVKADSPNADLLAVEEMERILGLLDTPPKD